LGSEPTDQKQVEPRGARIYSFGDFQLDEGLYELSCRGEPVKLAPKVFDVLRYLVRHRDRVVPKRELLERLWPNEHVTESVLPTNITAARKSLGDDRANPRMIQTVHGRGYRFIAPVQERSAEGPDEEGRTPGPETRAAPVERRGPAFIGRDETMAELRKRLEEAFAGRGAVVLLAGEPGIGKTRTVEELAFEAGQRDATVLDGRCYEGEGAPAFWPWVQILRSATRQLDPDTLREAMGAGALEIAHLVPELRQQFPELPLQHSLESDEARFRLFDSVSAFLVRASRRRPLVLFLDDLHWADEPTLLLLQFLAREIRDSRSLLVGAYRDVEVRRQHPLTQALGELAREPHFHRLLLRGLPEADVGRFIRSETETEAPETLVRAVYEMTEGNPFFIHETVRLLESEGRLEQGEGASWSVALPQGVRDVIGRRLNTLSEECNRVLRLASVIGRDFAVNILELLAELPRERVSELLEEAVEANIVTDDPAARGRASPLPLGHYTFSHALIRSTLYEELTSPQRARLHRKVGEVLEAVYGADSEAHLSELAHHFFQAAAGGDVERSINYSVRAAERALGLLAHEESVAHYQRALQALELRSEVDEVRRVELHLGLGHAQSRTGNEPAKRQSFLGAAELARRVGRGDLLARAAMGLGGWPPHSGRGGGDSMTPFSQAVEEFRALVEEALESIGEEDSPLRAQLISALALTPPDQDSMEARERMSQQAVEMARRSGDVDAIFVALFARLHALLGPDDTAKRLEVSKQILDLARRTGSKEKMFTGHENRVRALISFGDLQSADREIEALGHLADELRLPALSWSTGRFRVARALGDGRFDEAEQLAQTALGYAKKTSDAGAEPIVHTLWRTWLARERGDFDVARGLFEGFFRDYGEWAGQIPRAAAAYFSCVVGDREAARRHFDIVAAADFVDIPRDEDWLLSLVLLADACADLEDERRAASLYELLEPYAAMNAAHQTLRLYLGSVTHFLARLAVVLGRREEAIQHFEAALETNKRMGARPALARTQLQYARLLLRERGSQVPGSDEGRARELLSGAEATARALGMIPVLEAARELH
jgi:DNA-binding winged helix-turn-helix (wHTH) protein/tetratricopeptide (TPR) repeat protein